MQLCINLSAASDKIDQYDIIPKVAQAGFDGCFWVAKNQSFEDLPPIAQRIRQYGLSFQSIHAPFGTIEKLWEETEEGKSVLDNLVDWARASANVQVDLLVCHVWKGFGECHPTSIGIDRFGALLKEAEKEGVRIAFENTEGENLLEAIMNAHGNSPFAGFCIDTGHELCYNLGSDMIGKYGNKLFATHLNDNLGKTGEEITFLDDAHLFPFDGKVDWENVARRLKKANFTGPLTFELTTISKRGRNTHDRYAEMSVEDVLQEAYEKAKRFENLMK